MWRKIYIKLFFLVVCGVVVSFVPSANAAQILVGIVEDVTGFNADGGRAQRDGAILCIEEWNKKGGISGQKIEYAFRDNGGDPTKATTIAKEFVNMGVVGVKGGTSTTAGLAENSVLVPAQVPYVMGSMSSKFWELKGPDGKMYAFGFTGSEPVFAEIFPNVLKHIPIHKKAAILHINNLWGKSIRDTVTKCIKEKEAYKGIEVIGSVECDLRPTDASKEVLRIKELNPDAVITVLFPDAYKAYYRACQDLNYYPPSVSIWILAESIYLTSEPKLLYNTYGWAVFDGGKKVAVEKLEEFKKRFGYTPVGHWIMGYDALNVLLTGVKNVGTNRVAVRDWIATKSKGMPILSGNKRAVCRFEEGSPYFYSVLYPQDYGVVYIDKDGKQVWKD